MATAAQELLNLAFQRICDEENLKPNDTAFDWSEGEAERWLKDIALGSVRLSWSVSYDGDSAFPALR